MLSETLRKYWGHATFRPHQENIIKSILDGKDTLALLPTGGGKSICYQLPAVVSDGTCLVISPLVALMQDQVNNLNRLGIRAAAIYSSLPENEIDRILDNCIYGDVKILYLAPERIGSPIFQTRIKKIDVSFLAVDEAHCISLWGHDFRPAYKEIGEIFNHIPRKPIIAVTATATIQVLSDVIQSLNLQNFAKFQATHHRPNIQYQVKSCKDKSKELLRILKTTRGPVIVYTQYRKDTAKINSLINNSGNSSTLYHAGLDAKTRAKNAHAWHQDKVQIMVATNAFGMGIDKPNVERVVHWGIPMSMESYYQESGRAGRNGNLAIATLLYNRSDWEQTKINCQNSHPSYDDLKSVYKAVCNQLQIASGNQKESTFSLNITGILAKNTWSEAYFLRCVRILELHGVWSISRGGLKQSKVQFVNSPKLYLNNQKSILFRVIQVMLRSYSDLQKKPNKIHEHAIAKRANCTTTDVVRALDYLSNQKVIEYQKANQHPQITFLKTRENTANLGINKKWLQERKSNTLNQVRFMHKFINSDTCRPALIAKYFGEVLDHKCNKCDNCVNKNHKKTSKQDNTEIIRQKLTQQDLSMKTLLDINFPTMSKAEAADLVQELMEESIIVDFQGILKWHN